MCKSRDEWVSHSVVSNSLRPHGFYSPWNSPSQNTGEGSLSLLQGSSQPRNRTRVSCIAGEFFTNWVMREAFITYLFPVINCSTLEGTDFLYVWEMISGVWIWTHVLNYPNRSKSWQMRLQQKNICGVRNKIVDYSHFYNNYFYLIYLSKYQVHLCTLVLCNSYAFWASI